MIVLQCQDTVTLLQLVQTYFLCYSFISTSMSVSREEDRCSMFTDTDVLSYVDDNESTVDALNPQHYE